MYNSTNMNSIDILCTPFESRWLDANLVSIESLPGSDLCFLNFKNGRSKSFLSPVHLSSIVALDTPPKPPPKVIRLSES